MTEPVIAAGEEAPPAPGADGDSESDVFRKATLEAETLEDTTQDTEKEPYKSKYAARQVLEDALGNLETGTGKEAARLKCKIGVNKFLTEENSEGEKLMIEGVQVLEGESNWTVLEKKREEALSADATAAESCKENAVLVNSALTCQEFLDLVNTYNYLGILWSHRAGESLRAKHYLERAKELYDMTKDDNKYATKDTSSLREQYYTNTLFFLAQIYSSLNLGNQAAEMCIQTLQRQKKYGHSYDPFRWCTDAIGLSAFYGVGLGMTRIGSHCLSAALRSLPEKSDDEQKEELRKKTLSDLLRAQGAMYGEILEQGTKNISSKTKDSEEQEIVFSGPWGDEILQQTLGDEHKLDEFWEKDQVAPTVQTLTTFEAAREVFKVGNGCFQKAKDYYQLEGHATDHIAICQSQSRMYRCIAAFEVEVKRRLTMHQRRESLLSPLIKELNREYYAVLYQELTYELAEIAREMLHASIGRAQKALPKDVYQITRPGDIKRINDAALKMVEYNKLFIEAFEDAEMKDEKSGAGAATAEELQPFLQCHFWTAHAYNKMIPPDPSSVPAIICLLNLSLKYFALTYDLANKRLPKDCTLFTDEKEICREMMELLPQHISQLKSG